MKTEISVESKHQTLQGLAFPLQLDAQQAIQALKQKKINYIQLVSPWHGSPCTSKQPLLWHFCSLLSLSVNQKLDLERETIDLVHTSPTDISDLPKRIPQDSARYHFFLYKHSHEGDYLESVGEQWLLRAPGSALGNGVWGGGMAEWILPCRAISKGCQQAFGAQRMWGMHSVGSEHWAMGGPGLCA